jgi:nucleoside-diphosphate-sugar epimerase
MATIQKGETVLVTGATGFIGNAIVEELIVAGFKVRGTSRNASKAQFLTTYIAQKFGPGRLEIVEVPEMTAPNAYDEAVKGVAGIVHAAAILPGEAQREKVIPPCIQGNLEIFQSALKEPGIKSLVVTSSGCAALLPVANTRTVVTKDTWNEAILEVVRTNPAATPYELYAAGKTESEMAIWKAVQEHKPAFQVATILPSANYGFHIRAMGNSTNDWLVDAYNGAETFLSTLPPHWFINVRDDAKLHVAALIDPACNGERFLGFVAPYTLNQVLALLRKLYPDREFQEDKDMGEDLCQVSNPEVEALLKKHYGHGFTSFEETMKEGLAPAASGL